MRVVKTWEQWWAGDGAGMLPLMLRQATDLVETTVRDTVEAGGFPRLSMSAIHVLRELRESSQPQSSLASSMRMTRQGMAHIIRVLQRDGLVEAGPSWRDARYLEVYLTSRGKDAVRASDRANDDVLAMIGDTMAGEVLARMLLGLRLLGAKDAEEWLSLATTADRWLRTRGETWTDRVEGAPDTQGQRPSPEERQAR